MIWNFNDIIAATNSNSATADAVIDGIALDSRKATSGDLFVAINGDNNDGHDHIHSAHQAGAVAALVERPVDSRLPQIIVDDSVAGLTRLAAAARIRTSAKIIAITGSVGKTGTRHLVAACLQAQNSKTHSSKGNYNNHIGAPLSLASMPASSAFGVFELGMSHQGELARLSQLTKPDVAIITRIASSHLGNFKNIEAIAKAKAEVFQGLNEGGIAILNADDPHTPMLTELALKHGAAKVIRCGAHGDADVRINDIKPRLNDGKNADGINVSINLRGVPVSFSLGMIAPHWALSAAMGLAVVDHFGGDLDRSIKALSNTRDLDGRGARHVITLNSNNGGDGKTITLIDDSYNASPASMVAALLSLNCPSSAASRKVAILGDMLELGGQSARLHQDLSHAVITNGVQVLITFGAAMEHLRDALKTESDAAITQYHAASAEDVIANALPLLKDGDLVLVKGSNGMNTSKIVAALTHHASANGGKNAA